MPAKKIANPAPKIAPAVLKSFTDGGGSYRDFQFTRFWWQGPGEREGIACHVMKKLRPGSDPQFGSAARFDVVLPEGAPGEYMRLETLLKRYDETLPSYEFTAYAHIKIVVPSTVALHVSWECVRAFSCTYLAGELQLAVVMILHDPSIAGSPNQPHIHIMMPGRKLGINGFGEAAKDLCSDIGQRSCWTAWQAHLKAAA